MMNQNFGRYGGHDVWKRPHDMLWFWGFYWRTVVHSIDLFENSTANSTQILFKACGVIEVCWWWQESMDMTLDRHVILTPSTLERLSLPRPWSNWDRFNTKVDELEMKLSMKWLSIITFNRLKSSDISKSYLLLQKVFESYGRNEIISISRQ